MVDTPISEQAIIGLGIGAAVTGLRPIVDLMFMDFIAASPLDQIVNQAAKLKYMFGGGRQAAADDHHRRRRRAVGAAAQHSQSLGGAALPHPRPQGRHAVERRTT